MSCEMFYNSKLIESEFLTISSEQGHDLSNVIKNKERWFALILLFIFVSLTITILNHPRKNFIKTSYFNILELNNYNTVMHFRKQI